MAGLRILVTRLWLSRSHVVEQMARRVTVRLTSVAIAIGGLALMGFGTLGAPLTSGDVALAASTQANSNATSHPTPTPTPRNSSGVNNNSGGGAVTNSAVNHSLSARGGGGGSGGANGGAVNNVGPSGTNSANSAGDIFVEADGAPLGPGNETDVHLGCPSTVDLNGSNLSSSTGTYYFFAWEPSGSFQQVLSASGNSVAVPSGSLITSGQTAQPQQGYHFKVEYIGSNGETKYKTFWIDCAATTSTGGSTTSSTTSSAPGSSTSRTTSRTTAVPGSTTTVRTTIRTSTARAGVAGARTTTPKTGADIAFGVGLGLLLGGSGLFLGATRRGRRGKR